MIGHWKECSKTLDKDQNISDCEKIGGKLDDALELTWAFPKPDDVDSKDFFKIAIHLAKKYEQDVFIAKIDGDLGLFGKDGSRWEKWGNVSEKSISRGFSRIASIQGFSQTKKDRDKGLVRNIIFESINVSIPEDNNSSKQLFESIGILNPLKDE